MCFLVKQCQPCEQPFHAEKSPCLGPWLAARKREEGILIMQIKRELDSLRRIRLLDSWQDTDFKNIHIKQLIKWPKIMCLCKYLMEIIL